MRADWHALDHSTGVGTIRKSIFTAYVPTGMHSDNFTDVGTRFYHSQIGFYSMRADRHAF
mgnify:CR=1 FL=1